MKINNYQNQTMRKDKSFLNYLESLSSKINHPYPRTKSQSASSLSENKRLYSPQKGYAKPHYESSNLRPQFSRSNLTYNSFQQSGQFANEYRLPKKQHKQNLKQFLAEKRLSPVDSICLQKYKVNLGRSQSMNHMYQNQRIHMLQKMNSILENHITSKKQQAKIDEEQRKTQFRNHITVKIDRLEKYLYKIKGQRQKQQVPKNKPKTDKVTINPEVGIQDTLLKSENEKKRFQRAFEELDKIRNELKKARNEAIAVQKRNSLPKKQEPTKTQSSMSILKKNTPLQNHSQSNKIVYNNHVPNITQPSQTFSQTFGQINYGNFSTNQVDSFPEKRVNHHIGQFPKPVETQYNANPPIRRSLIGQSHSGSKPKITFTFLSKA